MPINALTECQLAALAARLQAAQNRISPALTIVESYERECPEIAGEKGPVVVSHDQEVDFHAIWPAARAVLETLEPYSGFLGSDTAAIIGGLIRGGDAIAPRSDPAGAEDKNEAAAFLPAARRPV